MINISDEYVLISQDKHWIWESYQQRWVTYLIIRWPKIELQDYFESMLGHVQGQS